MVFIHNCMQAKKEKKKERLFKSIPCIVLSLLRWMNRHLSYTGMKKYIYKIAHYLNGMKLLSIAHAHQ